MAFFALACYVDYSFVSQFRSFRAFLPCSGTPSAFRRCLNSWFHLVFRFISRLTFGFGLLVRVVALQAVVSDLFFQFLDPSPGYLQRVGQLIALKGKSKVLVSCPTYCDLLTMFLMAMKSLNLLFASFCVSDSSVLSLIHI